MALKRVEVVAAIIVRQGTVLATQRGYGDFEGWWEFPGGKIEAGESPEQALVREIREELNAVVEVGDFLCMAEYDYPTFHLSMHCYLCKLVDENFELMEHHAARWLDASSLEDVKWLPADIQIIEAIRDALIN
jgi:8-oxo-dGTP diphosphatase